MLSATSRTSTLLNEIQEAADQGYQAIGMTVGGSELVVITRKIVR